MKIILRILLLLITSIIAGNAADAQKPPKKIFISGVVRDLNNLPVPDAVIMIDGAKTNSSTNENGYFRVKVKRTAQTIGVLSTAGLPEENIEGRTIINFILKGSVMSRKIYDQAGVPEEEEVNVGYGTVRKGDLTQPVGKIDGNDRQNASYSSVYDMIKGKVPGVQVSGKSIRIQGANSFISSTEPLFVVDGVAAPTIDDITPQMVRSIEVLKGAAASIYGSRGANGVILITTKK